MGLDTPEKDSALLVLDGIAPPDMKDEQYSQIKPTLDDDGIHTVRVDEYVGPEGIGYTRVVSLVDKTGETWECAWHTGPETYRDKMNGVWVNVTKNRQDLYDAMAAEALPGNV